MKSILRNLQRNVALLGLAGACVAPVFAQDAAPKADAKAPAQEAAKEIAKEVAPDPSKVVVTINGQAIKQGEVDKFVQELMQKQMQMMAMQGQPMQPEQMQQMKQMVEKNAKFDVVKQTLVDQAINTQIKDVSDKDVESRIQEFRAFLKTQDQDLDELLKKRGSSVEELKGDLRKQLAFNKVMEKEEGVQPPSEDEIAKAYEEHKGQMEMPEQVRASHILIGFDGNPRDPQKKPPTDAEKAAKKKTADEVLAKAKKGEDFAKLAKEYSTDPSNKDNGGDLNFFGKGQMTKNFEDASFGTKPGNLTDVVETEFGYHIIKVTDHKDTRTLKLADVKFQLREKLFGDKTREKMNDLMTKLQKGAKIEFADGSKMPEPVDPAKAQGMMGEGHSPDDGHGHGAHAKEATEKE
jgi:peptidyl-prolyl cis-trans isomerase C